LLNSVWPGKPGKRREAKRLKNIRPAGFLLQADFFAALAGSIHQLVYVEHIEPPNLHEYLYCHANPAAAFLESFIIRKKCEVSSSWLLSLAEMIGPLTYVPANSD
jgi:hypothetical protein